jgi:peptidyl-prolyl cis-trans isomerase C
MTLDVAFSATHDSSKNLKECLMLKPNLTTLLTAVVAACLISLQGTALAESDSATNAAPKVIAVVNGQNLTSADFITFVSTRIGQNMTPANLNQEQLNALLGEYVNRELVYQDAVSKGLDKNPEVAVAIENQRHNIIAGYALRQIVSTPLSDKTLQDAYKNLASKPVKEYRASHVLVKTEAQAQELINSLKQGADFAKLAKENSIDASAQNGGQLGWLAVDQIVPPVRDALGNLKTGSYSTAPVQSQFGWHVLKLEETRIIPPPAFEEVKDRLSRQLHNEDISKYINQLSQSGKIEIKRE